MKSPICVIYYYFMVKTATLLVLLCVQGCAVGVSDIGDTSEPEQAPTDKESQWEPNLASPENGNNCVPVFDAHMNPASWICTVNRPPIKMGDDQEGLGGAPPPWGEDSIPFPDVPKPFSEE